MLKIFDITPYYETLYEKYHNLYGWEKEDKLKRLLAVKRVNYSANLSYLWTNIFLGAILAAIFSRFDSIILWIESKEIVLWMILIMDCFIPLFSLCTYPFIGIPLFKLSIFYISILVVVCYLTCFASLNEEIQLLILLIVFIAIMYGTAITLMDRHKQRKGIEIMAITDILDTRKISVTQYHRKYF